MTVGQLSRTMTPFVISNTFYVWLNGDTIYAESSDTIIHAASTFTADVDDYFTDEVMAMKVRGPQKQIGMHDYPTAVVEVGLAKAKEILNSTNKCTCDFHSVIMRTGCQCKGY